MGLSAWRVAPIASGQKPGIYRSSVCAPRLVRVGAQAAHPFQSGAFASGDDDRSGDRASRRQHRRALDPARAIRPPTIPPCPLPAEPSSVSHLDWVKNLADEDVSAGVRWLQEIVDAFAASNKLGDC